VFRPVRGDLAAIDPALLELDPNGAKWIGRPGEPTARLEGAGEVDRVDDRVVLCASCEQTGVKIL
jgi:hypothetical protein